MKSFATLLVPLLFSPLLLAQDLNEKNEQVMKAAAATVASSVVKIETAGGAEIVGGPSVMAGGIRKGTGPTTGVIVSPDGYIVTSSFNFANKPSDIFVTLPGKAGRVVAKQIAHDTTRMLTLIKVDVAGLPVPGVFPKREFQVGQWAIALGRTLSSEPKDPPSISIGIVSALGRIWGKALQTDAKVSPLNYGGPLVAVDGRVMGILVPLSPRADGDTAGVEWYDSGIGFAVPFADVMEVLPRLKLGKDLRRGLLGITPKSTDLYAGQAIIGTVSPDSAAAKAGIKPGDKIVSIDGKPVSHFSHVQHILGPKYEGDTVSIRIARKDEVEVFPSVKLTGIVTAVATPYLGILPLRDDPELGVELRGVLPEGPSAKAGLMPGDRLLKLQPTIPNAPRQPQAIALSGQGRAQLSDLIHQLPIGTEIEFEVKRKPVGKAEAKIEKVKVTLGSQPDELPVGYLPPQPASAKKALEKPKAAINPMAPKDKKANEKAEDKKPEKKDVKKDDDEKKEPELGLLRRKNTTVGQDYWVYVPENYNPNIGHGVILWLHPQGRGGKDADDMVKIWKPFLEDYHYILIGPQAAGVEGWVASETEVIMQDFKEVAAIYTIDRNRVIAHGMAIGGQMAFYLGFQARDTIRGVATTGAALASQPKDNVLTQPLSFFIVGGDKDPAIKEIAKSKPALQEKKFPLIYRQLPEFGKEYLDQKTLTELCLWMELLDKI